jgi:3-deoxy-D-arabino-heptulosonate 7-phosphate (DAHP) synthase class II
MIIIEQDGERIYSVVLADSSVVLRSQMHETVDSDGRVLLMCGDCGEFFVGGDYYDEES